MDQTLNEAKVLNRLAQGAPFSEFAVPRLVFAGQIADECVLVQSVLDGLPMHAGLGSNGLPDAETCAPGIRIARACLVEIHRKLRDNPPSASLPGAGPGCEPLREFAGLFDLTGQERDFLKHLEGNLKSVCDDYRYLQHGDYCRHNFLIPAGSTQSPVGIIDWTESRLLGWPLYDLFFFLTTYYLQLRKQEGLAGFLGAFEYTFFSPNPFQKLVRQNIREYCGQLSVDPNKLEIFFALFLIERALFEAKKIMQCSREGLLPRFSSYLAALEGLDQAHAHQAQIWIHFFKYFAAHRGDWLVDPDAA